MNVAEAKALRERMHEAKEKLDGDFNNAYDALTAAIRPHAMNETNTILFRTGTAPRYSHEELALLRAQSAASALARALEVAKDEVAKASFEAPMKPGGRA